VESRFEVVFGVLVGYVNDTSTYSGVLVLARLLTRGGPGPGAFVFVERANKSSPGHRPYVPYVIPAGVGNLQFEPARVWVNL